MIVITVESEIEIVGRGLYPPDVNCSAYRKWRNMVSILFIQLFGIHGQGKLTVNGIAGGSHIIIPNTQKEILFIRVVQNIVEIHLYRPECIRFIQIKTVSEHRPGRGQTVGGIRRAVVICKIIKQILIACDGVTQFRTRAIVFYDVLHLKHGAVGLGNRIKPWHYRMKENRSGFIKRLNIEIRACISL